MRRAAKVKWFFILPASLWVLAFTIFPFFYGLYLSLFNVQFGVEDQFIGLGNYSRALEDPRAHNSITVTLIFVFVGVSIQLVLGMLVALLVNRPMPLRSMLRALITLPLFATPIAVGFLFFTIFYEEGGLINGLIGVKIPWLSTSHFALLSVIIVDTWQWTPFCFLIFLAALQGIPEEYYEAAALETTNNWKTFWHITFPFLQPTFILVILLRVTEAVKVFDIPYTLTTGGPGVATQVLSMFSYRAGMRFFDFGYSSAISFMVFIIVMIMIFSFFGRIRQSYS
ncbi:MAG TPA: ABC transporter permease [Deltaproteobacteria bacterium]|nr:ABC transporter permease [Deltaproteobacteria bacterium]